MVRYTEYHGGKAVIKDKSLLPQAMEKLAKIEDMSQIPEIVCDQYCKYVSETPAELKQCCEKCKLAKLFEILSE